MAVLPPRVRALVVLVSVVAASALSLPQGRLGLETILRVAS